MLPTEIAINGLATTEIEFSHPEYALTEFYRAFNTGDLELMASNWGRDEESSMSNPLGGVKRGWNSIQSVYERIFGGGTKIYVEFYDYSIHQSSEMFIAVGRERGYVQQGNNKIDLAIRTSRTYRIKGDRWQQLHHHGSIDNPELLRQYQGIVSGK